MAHFPSPRFIATVDTGRCLDLHALGQGVCGSSIADLPHPFHFGRNHMGDPQLAGKSRIQPANEPGHDARCDLQEPLRLHDAFSSGLWRQLYLVGPWSGYSLVRPLVLLSGNTMKGAWQDHLPVTPTHPVTTMKSLVMVSELYRAALNGQSNSIDSVAAVNKADAALDRYTELHAKGAPFMHHVLSRFLMVPHMVGQKGAETLFETPFSDLPLWMKLFKLFQMALYGFVVMFGAIAAFTMLWNWRKAGSLSARWIPLVAIYMVAVYPLVLKMAEFRFMVHIFPLILLLAVCFTVVLLEKWLGQNVPSILCDPQGFRTAGSGTFIHALGDRSSIAHIRPLATSSKLTFACSWTI